ncbi:hypothetical protein SASPL_152336 [Salvia splendens]|uniref:Uncharacterized protein n=1 Tax=Salvia splendens TaxID=180675 RepID=A0A8X8W3N9_SALSN|nr:hypothetical protein SASPL_152336 [Salvia splendens]
MDSVLLGTMKRLKLAAGCGGSVFPSHFITEAKIAIEKQLGLVFECESHFSELITDVAIPHIINSTSCSD